MNHVAVGLTIGENAIACTSSIVTMQPANMRQSVEGAMDRAWLRSARPTSKVPSPAATTAESAIRRIYTPFPRLTGFWPRREPARVCHAAKCIQSRERQRSPEQRPRGRVITPRSGTLSHQKIDALQSAATPPRMGPARRPMLDAALTQPNPRARRL